MVVSVRLFAILAERAGAGTVEIELADGATVADAIEQIGRRPGLDDTFERLEVVMAVNRDYADRDAVLQEGDELALIPPVSGGAPNFTRIEPKTEWGRRFWAAVDGEEPGPPCAQLLGWTALEMEPGRSRIEFEARPEFVNPGGVVQGGFLAAMLDDTMGPSAVAANGGDAFTPTLELKVSFLRPARPGRLVADGHVVHMGRSIVFLAGSLSDEQGKVVATATATSRLVKFDEEFVPGPPAAAEPPSYDDQPPQPADGSFDELIGQKVGGMPASMGALCGRPISAEPGVARIEFRAGEQHLNPNGVVQGGFLAAMLDDTIGPAGITLLEPGLVVPTLELKTSFLRPARPGPLLAEARVVHRGRSIIFGEAMLTDPDGQAVASATGTATVAPLEAVLGG